MKIVEAIVRCDKHGRENAGNKTKEVRLNMPSSKKKRTAGCPMCAKGLPATNE